MADPRSSEPVVDGSEGSVEGALSALTALGPEAGALVDLDPALFGRALAAAAAGVARHPGSGRVGRPALCPGPRPARAWRPRRAPRGAAPRARCAPDAGDRRFADPAWADNPGFFALRQAYLAAAGWPRTCWRPRAGPRRREGRDSRSACSSTRWRRRTSSPTNPAALKRAFETGGPAWSPAPAISSTTCSTTAAGRARSTPAVPGRREHGGDPGQGRVPQRADGADPVRAADHAGARDPAAGQPAVDQQVLRHGPRARAAASSSGRCSTGAPCSRSPTATRTPRWAASTMDDYLVHGPRAALDVIAEITGSPTDRHRRPVPGRRARPRCSPPTWPQGGDDRIGSLTLLNTLLDYSEPGVLGAFTDEETVARLEQQMAEKGYLEGADDGRHLRPAARQRPDLQLRGRPTG